MRPHRLCVLSLLLLFGCKDEPEKNSFSENLTIQADHSGPVINEILFDPLSDTKDALPDQPEFIEIYNAGTRAIDLTGWKINGSPTTKGSLAFVSTSGSSVIEPGQYAVITAENNGKNAGSSLTAYYTYLPAETGARIFIVKGKTTLSLNNSGDSIYLLDNYANVIDQVAYLPAWHNPANKESKRISLEKYNPLMPSDSPLSWSSSTDAWFGGTPGRINAIYVAPSRTEEMFRISPIPFSPDGDLNNDLLKISVTLPVDTYQLVVEIYDTVGSKVRTLAAGLPAGPATLLTWDGCDNSGQALPPGSYRVSINASGFSGSRYSVTESAVLVR